MKGRGEERKRAKSLRAEILFGAWIESCGYEVERRKGVTGVFRPWSGKVVSSSRDIFKCIDVLGMRDDDPPPECSLGLLTFAQVTTPGQRSHRKRKIKRRRWPSRLVALGYVTILVATHEPRSDPSDRRVRRDYWRIDFYEPADGGGWRWRTAIYPFSAAKLKRPGVSEEIAAEAERRVKEMRGR